MTLTRRSREDAWALVVENLPLIRDVIDRRFSGLTYLWGPDDLWPYAVESVFGILREGHRNDEPLIAVAAYRGAVDGLRHLEQLDGKRRHDLVPRLLPKEMTAGTYRDSPDQFEPWTVDEDHTVELEQIRKLPYPVSAIVALRYAGWTNREVGALLRVSESRISQHLADYRRRLNVRLAVGDAS